MRQLVMALLGVLILALPAMAVDSMETPADMGGDINLPPTPGDIWSAPRDVLFDNGPVLNSPGSGVGGADESILQSVTLEMNTLGFGHQHTLGYLMADDFTVPAGETWTIDSITFFAYQTNSGNTSTITGVYFEIWDGAGPQTGNLIAGDTTTNTLVNSAWTNIYRVTETTTGTSVARPIMANVGAPAAPIVLTAGTYWLDWNTDGSLSSGPWAPPRVVYDQCETGNGWQYTTSWAPALDGGVLACPQGFPFIIQGTSGGGTPVEESTWGAIKNSYR